MPNAIQEEVLRYKRAHGFTYEQLGRLWQCSGDYARKMGAGMLDSISSKLARRIEKNSRGEIQAADLLFPTSSGRRRA